MKLLVGVVMIVVAAGSGARAEDHVVARPGIMCRSPAALAILTLPGGDSRTHRLPPSGRDLAIARSGGCRELMLGQSLHVVQAFRNTAIVTLEGEPGAARLPSYVAPIIDLAPAAAAQTQAPPPDPASGLPRDAPISEAGLTSIIGQNKADFSRAHPESACDNPKPDIERCVDHAVDGADCPLAYRCNDVIYEFRDGRMTSFQVGLSLEADWKAAYRKAQDIYPVQQRARTGSGESIFFRTERGILGFGRTFVRVQGVSPIWAIRYSLISSEAEPD